MDELQECLMILRMKQRKESLSELIVWFNLNMQGGMWGNSKSIRKFVKSENR